MSRSSEGLIPEVTSLSLSLSPSSYLCKKTRRAPSDRYDVETETVTSLNVVRTTAPTRAERQLVGWKKIIIYSSIDSSF